jgi:dTDP-4-dehydrorhamnose 3,5-epimerase
MRVTPTELPDVLLVEPRVFTDARGAFTEAFSHRRYAEAGIPTSFVQDNVSWSRRGVLRGLHFQEPNGQGKLVSVVHGAVFDVAVDVRVGSPTFGRWTGVELSGENHRQLWIPPGFAHGFVVTSEHAVFTYKCTGYYDAASDRTLRWDDPRLAIAWPVRDLVLSPKDAEAPGLDTIDPRALPRYEGRASPPQAAHATPADAAVALAARAVER